ncbi:hypothetical protein KY289_035530 [Solanum tuberosum]|nr:hypothetical protein KY289_035530 [Solanum tuberosum]
MDSLADLVEIQSWTHLFMTKSLVLHEKQVQEFYYNVKFAEDGSLNTWVRNESLHLDEELLRKILEVPREGIRSVVGKSCSKQFVKECSKLSDMHRAGFQKNLLKGEYQLLFEFVNKHMYKTVIEHKGKHGMDYGYFLTKVFKHLNIPMGLGTVGTAKQSFSLNTLVECECIEGRARPLSKMSQLVMEQNQLKHELDDMIVLVSNKDTYIALLKAQLLKAQIEGPGTKEANTLRSENAALLAKNVALQEKMIKDHDEANDRLTLAIKSLSHQLPST